MSLEAVSGTFGDIFELVLVLIMNKSLWEDCSSEPGLHRIMHGCLLMFRSGDTVA